MELDKVLVGGSLDKVVGGDSGEGERDSTGEGEGKGEGEAKLVEGVEVELVVESNPEMEGGKVKLDEGLVGVSAE